MSTSLQTSLFYPEKLASAEKILAKVRQKRAYLHRQVNSSSTTTMHKIKKLKTQSHVETRQTKKNGDENISINEPMEEDHEEKFDIKEEYIEADNTTEKILQDIHLNLTMKTEQALKHSSHQNIKCEDHCDIRFSFEDINIHNTSLKMESNQEDIKSKFKKLCNDEYDLNIHDPTEYLSEYEQKVQQNIAERLQFLTHLNIGDAKDDLLKFQSIKSNGNTTIAASKKYLQKPKSSAPVRRSLRLQEKPNLLQCDTEFNPESLCKTEHVPETRQKPKVGKPLVRYLDKKDCSLELDQAWLHAAAAFSNTGTESCWTDLAENILEGVGALQLKEAYVTKVVPQRIISMAMHPTNDTDLLLAADKQGYLGLWSVDNNDLFKLKVHADHINRLSVHSNNMGCVLTSSYDGSARATHLDANTVTELYSIPEETARLTWHAQQSSNTLLITSTEGKLAQVDMRSPGHQATLHALSSKSVKVVTVHPKETHYIATVDSSGKTCLWDSRRIKRYSPVCSFEHMRSCSGLTFSPVTGKYLLSTCYDNTLRLLNVNNFSSITNERTQKHNNKTGRWLTPLKADFLPDREDLILVGSLNSNRVIEVWHNINKCYHLTDDLLQTFCSTVCCHPTRPVIAGGNSSGKCYVFK